MQCVPTSAMALAAWRNLELGEEIRIGWGDRGGRCDLPFAWEDGSGLVDVQIVENGEGRVDQTWVLAEEEAIGGFGGVGVFWCTVLGSFVGAGAHDGWDLGYFSACEHVHQVAGE